MNTKTYISNAMEAMLSGDNDRALGLLLRASLAHDEEISLAKAASEPTKDDLPEITPLREKAKKPKDIKCPTCGAKPGTECFVMTSRGPHGKPTEQRRAAGSTTHTARRRAVK